MVALGLIAVAATFGDLGTVQDLQSRDRQLERPADAVRVGAAEVGPWLIFEPFPDLTPLLSSIGHHLFDSRYEGACGLLGTTLGRSDVVPVGDDVRAGRARIKDDGRLPSAVIISSWVSRPGWDVECAAVTDDDGAIVGAGRPRSPTPAGAPRGAMGGETIAPDAGSVHWLVVRFDQSPTLYALPIGPPGR